MTTTQLLSATQLKPSSASGKVTCQIASPLPHSYLGLPPAGTVLQDGSGQPYAGDGVLSIATDGTVQIRPLGTDGTWEQATVANGTLQYNAGTAGLCFVVPVGVV